MRPEYNQPTFLSQRGRIYAESASGREHFARTISNVSLTATSGRARSPLKDEPVEDEKKGGRRGKKEEEEEEEARRRVEEEEERKEWRRKASEKKLLDSRLKNETFGNTRASLFASISNSNEIARG